MRQPSWIKCVLVAASLHFIPAIGVNLCVQTNADTTCSTSVGTQLCCGGIGNSVCCVFPRVAQQFYVSNLGANSVAQMYGIASQGCSAYLGGCGPSHFGVTCCLDTGGEINYANWFSRNAKSKRAPEISGSMEPNYIAYEVDGVVRNVAIPEGKLHEATQAMISGNHTVLHSWKTYNGEV